jgi:hypothetical protein
MPYAQRDSDRCQLGVRDGHRRQDKLRASAYSTLCKNLRKAEMRQLPISPFLHNLLLTQPPKPNVRALRPFITTSEMLSILSFREGIFRQHHGQRGSETYWKSTTQLKSYLKILSVIGMSNAVNKLKIDAVTARMRQHRILLCYLEDAEIAHEMLAAAKCSAMEFFATLCRTMDGSCIYCMAVYCTLSLRLFFICSFSISCCQYLVLDVIPLFNVDCHRLRSGRVAEGLFPLEG